MEIINYIYKMDIIQTESSLIKELNELFSKEELNNIKDILYVPEKFSLKDFMNFLRYKDCKKLKIEKLTKYLNYCNYLGLNIYENKIINYLINTDFKIDKVNTEFINLKEIDNYTINYLGLNNIKYEKNIYNSFSYYFPRIKINTVKTKIETLISDILIKKLSSELIFKILKSYQNNLIDLSLYLPINCDKNIINFFNILEQIYPNCMAIMGGFFTQYLYETELSDVDIFFYNITFENMVNIIDNIKKMFQIETITQSNFAITIKFKIFNKKIQFVTKWIYNSLQDLLETSDITASKILYSKGKYFTNILGLLSLKHNIFIFDTVPLENRLLKYYNRNFTPLFTNGSEIFCYKGESNIFPKYLLSDETDTTYYYTTFSYNMLDYHHQKILLELNEDINDELQIKLNIINILIEQEYRNLKLFNLNISRIIKERQINNGIYILNDEENHWLSYNYDYDDENKQSKKTLFYKAILYKKLLNIYNFCYFYNINYSIMTEIMKEIINSTITF